MSLAYLTVIPSLPASNSTLYPSCLAAAFDINTFCLIGPTDASALLYDRLVKIKSKNYNSKREIGILRHGDNFDQSDEEVNSIDVKTVLDKIVEFSN